MPLAIVNSAAALEEALRTVRTSGEKIAFVPTMGALHEGHLTLVREARRLAPFVVVSIFVNPTQFGPQEDFSRYPRDLPGDAAKLQSAEANLLFAPSQEDIYPPGFQTTVEVGEVTDGLCGAYRPGHFRGVTTVVARLFGLVKPHLALFGEKDYQQLVAIKTMTRDLALGIEIVGVPTVREPDGLALSSRNVYLSPEERTRACALFRGLSRAQNAAREGEKDVARLLDLARQEIVPAVDTLQYLEIRDAETLRPLSTLSAPARILCAAFIGKTRLIDNLPLA